MIIFLKEIFGNKNSKKLDPNKNYCLDCGACCNYFKVYFPKEESSALGGQVPADFVEKYDKKSINMIGRQKFRGGISCKALEGEIGKQVSCSIYENRPSVCRAFEVISPVGVQNTRCKKARVYFGLPGDLEP
jgi:Fe-S-cluster containining protein